jgi:general secretion pathway protein H
MPGPLREARHGFTLLELLVVLVIIALAGSIIAFGVGGGLENMRLRAASKQLLAIMRHARDQAASLKTKTSVEVDQETRRVLFQGGKGDYELPEDVLVKEKTTIEFFPSGGSSGGEVVLENRRGRSYRVKVDRLTGVPRILQGDED